ncbi:MAG TPA: DNA polymerase III subunit epsilon [Giesbergeria sp.]|jgi:DNA polymerase-3 subunit epsilon|nr:DNA polymerase III subunit epsilon [Giesbergeria sp.]HNK05593.1 DNA polymerase III subunit epsilon [Giesbergeria sp.]HNM40399.1 DNA polymerase III subunit epsilon [Giesbergeria sp.]HNN88502.1 DNA polymerase III subunit epsilon [Giesbergeria sp.]
MARQVVFDTETTGLSAENGDRILEIGCVELLHRKLTGRRLHLYINPERESEEGALRVHGLTTEFLSDKPKFAEVADQILDFMRDAEIIIHNAAFDVGFINKELERLNLPPLASHVAGIVDTLALAKEMFPGKRNSLDALCDRLGVDNSARTLHGALLDAELLADVYICLTRGQDALLIADDAGDTGGGPRAACIDLSGLHLPVLQANDQELAAHEALLAQLDKESKGKTVWRKLQTA